MVLWSQNSQLHLVPWSTVSVSIRSTISAIQVMLWSPKQLWGENECCTGRLGFNKENSSGERWTPKIYTWSKKLNFLQSARLSGKPIKSLAATWSKLPATTWHRGISGYHAPRCHRLKMASLHRSQKGASAQGYIPKNCSVYHTNHIWSLGIYPHASLREKKKT